MTIFLESNDQILESNDQILESNDPILESNDPILESNDQIVESNDQILESNDQILESNDQFLKLSMYYLKHELECFIRYKARGAAERFISDKARIASVLNSLKNDPFYTYLVTLFTKKFSI